MSYADDAAYALRGPADSVLVVALHGLTADRGQPLALLDGLPEDVAVLAPDLRGHGATRLDGPAAHFTARRLATDVVELVDRLDLRPRRVRVVGISMGATVALELTRLGALPIDAAVHVRPAHAAVPPVHLAVNGTIARLLREDPGTAEARLLDTEEYRAVAAVSERHAASLRRKAAAAGATRRLLALENGSWLAFGPDTDDRATGLARLVVAAERDPLHPVAVAEEWARRLPGTRLVVVPADDGPAVQAARVGEGVRAFLLSGVSGPS